MNLSEDLLHSVFQLNVADLSDPISGLQSSNVSGCHLKLNSVLGLISIHYINEMPSTNEHHCITLLSVQYFHSYYQLNMNSNTLDFHVHNFK